MLLLEPTVIVQDGTVVVAQDGIDIGIEDGVVVAEQEDTDTDIPELTAVVKHNGILVAQQDDTDTDIPEHDGTFSVPPEDTLDLVYQLLTSSGSIPRLIKLSTRSKVLFINSVSGNTPCTNMP